MTAECKLTPYSSGKRSMRSSLARIFINATHSGEGVSRSQFGSSGTKNPS